MIATTADFLNIDRNLAAIDRQWPALLALCDDNAVFAANAPTVSGWGVAQQAHHVALELALVAGEVENMLAHPEQGAGLTPSHPLAMRVLEQGHFPRGSGQAPQDVVPPAALARGETRALIESTKIKWEKVGPNRGAFARSTATHPHPILGPFTFMHWFRFIPIHTAHHLKIVHDILTANALPVPYGTDVESVN